MILIIIATFLLVSFSFIVSADYGEVKRGNCVEIRDVLNTTALNLSIYYPNFSVAVDGVNMSKDDQRFNYSFCDTNYLGVYRFDYFDPVGNVYDNSFEVTQLGYRQTTAEALGSSIMLIGFLFLTFLFLYVGFKLTETENLWIFGVLLMGVSIFFVVYDLYLGMIYSMNFIGTDKLSGMPEKLFYIFLIAVVAGLLVSAIVLIRHLPKVIDWLKRSMGLKKDEDDWDNNQFD